MHKYQVLVFAANISSIPFLISYQPPPPPPLLLSPFPLTPNPIPTCLLPIFKNPPRPSPTLNPLFLPLPPPHTSFLPLANLAPGYIFSFPSTTPAPSPSHPPPTREKQCPGYDSGTRFYRGKGRQKKSSPFRSGPPVQNSQTQKKKSNPIFSNGG